jgi:hypothetical protein
MYNLRPESIIQKKPSGSQDILFVIRAGRFDNPRCDVCVKSAVIAVKEVFA